MDFETKLELSVIYSIKDGLHQAGCNTIADNDQAALYRDEAPYYVNVVSGWPQGLADMELPVVAVYNATRFDTGLQIGGNYNVYEMYYVDIFAARANERNFLRSTIFEWLNDRSSYVYDLDGTVPHYQIVSGESVLSQYWPSGVASAESEMIFMDTRAENIQMFNRTGEVENHRALVSFTTWSIR